MRSPALALPVLLALGTVRLLGILTPVDRGGVPPRPDGSGELMRVDHYDAFAESYSADNESSLFNAYYERPAMMGLAGDVTGRRVLDAGCGSGPLSAALLARGAVVTAFDASPAMVGLARRRLGDGAALQVADLSRPLPFSDGAFDDVVVSLVLHYLRDWTTPLAELRRVLVPGGRLLLSVIHPTVYKLSNPSADYFAVTQYSEEYPLSDGQSMVLTYWHRPLHAMTDAFTAAGFRLSVIAEPPAAPDTPRELFPPTSATAGRSSAFCSSSWRRAESMPRQVLPTSQQVRRR